MAAWLQLLCLFMITRTVAQPPTQVCLMVPEETDNCYRELQGTMLTDRASQVACLRNLLWHFTENNTVTDQDMAAIMQLADSGQAAVSAARVPGQGQQQQGASAAHVYPRSGYRTRKEYRTLTRAQRRRFHRALNQLYRDGTIAMFARIHAAAADKHHGGASFLPWHRAFLAYFEESLRRVDPSVSLPYWDYTMDFDMANPANSIIWSPNYFGNGVGDVTSGPAAGWVTNQGRLQRDYGRMSRLMSKDNLRQVLTRCRIRDISRTTARPRYDLERMHDGVHVWVGGDMGAPSTAAYDFIFYLHHAYIDLVWEMFRRNQIRRCRVNPENDYPREASGAHGPNEPMVAFTWLKNSDGLANYWTQNWYGYADPPSCPRCCPRCRFPRPISCNRRRRVCVARSRRIIPRPAGMVAPGAAPVEEVLDIQSLPQAVRADVARDAAAEATLVPRNRGRPFQGPPGFRTRSDALQDAFQASLDAQNTDAGFGGGGQFDMSAAARGLDAAPQSFDMQGMQSGTQTFEGQGSQARSQSGTLQGATL